MIGIVRLVGGCGSLGFRVLEKRVVMDAFLVKCSYCTGILDTKDLILVTKTWPFQDPSSFALVQ